MENLDKVIQALEYCLGSNEDCGECYLNDYDGCRDQLNLDALNLLNDLRYDNQRLREMWADAEKKLSILRAELAEERERSARWLRESEPVVHACWDNEDCCTACGEEAIYYWERSQYIYTKRCPHCGAHMDEEVAHE